MKSVTKTCIVLLLAIATRGSFADSEADAVRTYADFAQKCADPAVKAVFMDIVREESTHLLELKNKVAEM